MSAVIVKKDVQLNEELVVSWLDLDGTGHLTTQDVADMLGVTRANIQQIAARHGLMFVTPSDEHIQQMKDLGVIPLRAPTVNLLPRETIDSLVKIVSTPEATSAWRRVLAEARGEATGIRAELEELRERLDRAPLNPEQHEQAYQAMRARYLELKIYHEGIFAPTLAVIKADVKARFKSSALPGNETTWKWIPQYVFQELMDYINAWQPSELQDRKVKEIVSNRVFSSRGLKPRTSGNCSEVKAAQNNKSKE